MRFRTAGTLSLLVFAQLPIESLAAYVPPGLQPGEEYQLLFVTRGRFSIPDFNSDVGVFDAQVMSEAARSPLLTGSNEGVTWRALVSTRTVDARDHVAIEAPVFLLGVGDLLATGFGDFWDGTLSAEPRADQFGDQSLSTFAWSGSLPDGTARIGFEVNKGSSAVQAGSPSSLSASWFSFGTQSTGGVNSFYAVSEVLTAPPIPEPSSLVISLTLGTAAATWSMGRRRR